MSTFPTPAHDRYFEDYVIGAMHECGSVSVTAAEIVEFAERYDPQPIHIDPTAASSGPFGGLIASGWQTVGLMTRLFVANYLTAVASYASPGVDEVRWLKPLRPGDALRVRVTVVDARRSRSKPDRGIVVSLIEAIGPDGDIVAHFRATNLIGLRHP
jgi:acyl dehydratase